MQNAHFWWYCPQIWKNLASVVTWLYCVSKCTSHSYNNQYPVKNVKSGAAVVRGVHTGKSTSYLLSNMVVDHWYFGAVLLPVVPGAVVKINGIINSTKYQDKNLVVSARKLTFSHRWTFQKWPQTYFKINKRFAMAISVSGLKPYRKHVVRIEEGSP